MLMLFASLRSYLDMLKVIMFSYLFWFVLTIIFITARPRISVSAWVTWWRVLLPALWWRSLAQANQEDPPFLDFLIAYNVFVITMKNVFAVSVLYLKEMPFQFSHHGIDVWNVFIYLQRNKKEHLKIFINLLFYFTVQWILHFIWQYIFSI